MLEKVIKRDGSEDSPSLNKIMKAISQSMERTSVGVDIDLAQTIAEQVLCKLSGVRGVEEIQDEVERQLMKSKRKDAAKEYIKYREKRTVARQSKVKDVFMEIVNTEASDITQENANMNADTPAGMMMKFASETTKPFVRNYLLSEEAKELMDNNFIHPHDLDMYPSRSSTCAFWDTLITLRDNKGNVHTETIDYFDTYYEEDTIGWSEVDKGLMTPGRQGWTTIRRVHRRKIKDGVEDKLFHIKTQVGAGLKLTGDHQVPVFDGEEETLLKVWDLEVGQCLILVNPATSKYSSVPDKQLTTIVSITDITEGNEEEYVYDIETDEHWFIANNYVVHNCLQSPMDKLLANGFSAGHGEARAAKRIETAAILLCISLETTQNEQHGGQAIPAFDYYLAPYVRMTYIEELKKLEQATGLDLSSFYKMEFKDYLTTDICEAPQTPDRLLKLAINNTVSRVHQSMESFVHNLNSIHSRGGSSY